MALQYEKCNVKVNIGDQQFVDSYQQIKRESVTVDDLLSMLSDEKLQKSVISDWFYGQDLREKAAVRNAILDKQAGPEKAINKLAKDIFKMRAANGKPVSEEKARALAQAYLDAE